MEKYLNILIRLLEKSKKNREVPIAALVVKNGKIISQAINNREKKLNVTGHAEVICIQKAAKRLKRWNLNDCTLYVTLKPCNMCQSIISEAKIKNVYYLLEKLDYKKPYAKTKYCEIKTDDKVKQCYKQKLRNFFENKR